MKDSRYLEERKHIQIPLTSAKTLSRESSAPKMNPPPATSSASASFFDPLSPSPSPFFISDLFVACEKFVYHSFLNRLLNLPTYYAAQFLIAYSISSLFAH